MARVLIVDDNEGDRLFQRTVLERAGHDVFFARDGEEGVKAYVRRGIDVVLTDIQMPNVDGLELISVLGEFLPVPPIIAISGKGLHVLDQASELGAMVTLTKPVEPSKLLAAVDEALTARS